MVSVLAIGLKVFRLKPGRGDGVFRVKKKSRRTPSFEGEEKPSSPSRENLRHVKEF
jgi:hypothetical protein